ncbi:hypothetical protein ACFLUZ_06350 [Chloroflexota bacterium]
MGKGNTEMGKGSGEGQRLINRRIITRLRLHNLPYYVIINVKMRNLVIISGFALIFVGTVGLLLNEFVLDASSSCTIILAVANLVGLVSLAFTRFAMRD